MVKEIEKLIDSVYYIPYTKEAKQLIENALSTLKKFVHANLFLKANEYLTQIEYIRSQADNISSFRSEEDRLLQRKIQKQLANLGRTMLEENKKIFVVHGRNISMRDKVCATLGRLKLDYVILESEHNTGATIIEKFLRNAAECRYAVVLFSADDVGKLDDQQAVLKSRTRQNVILELGYFLGTIGRSNILILHEVGHNIEKPSDFEGIVYEPFDEFGAWKGKLMKELKRSGIYLDPKLSDRV
jgi:predicted nucleotide-binding protein